jgi:Ser/Thr protein kinase RdoA (MazF antagonist)
VLFSEECQDALRSNTRDILCKTDQKVREAFAHLYKTPLDIQVIHNDLHHDNVKICHNCLMPFDFEDAIWGYPVQDIALSLQDLPVEYLISHPLCVYH